MNTPRKNSFPTFSSYFVFQKSIGTFLFQIFVDGVKTTSFVTLILIYPSSASDKFQNPNTRILAAVVTFISLHHPGTSFVSTQTPSSVCATLNPISISSSVACYNSPQIKRKNSLTRYSPEVKELEVY